LVEFFNPSFNCDVCNAIAPICLIELRKSISSSIFLSSFSLSSYSNCPGFDDLNFAIALSKSPLYNHSYLLKLNINFVTLFFAP
jgi:hypothetical protein